MNPNNELYLAVRAMELAKDLPECFTKEIDSEYLWIFGDGKYIQTEVTEPHDPTDENGRDLIIHTKFHKYHSLSDVVDQAILNKMSNPNTCVVLAPYYPKEMESLVEVLDSSAPQNYQLSTIGEHPIAILNLNQTTGTDN